ncbi:MAG: metallophosphoesterase [Candidatus Dormiibacterota bacterium]
MKRSLKLFYAADVHGSEQVFRKFLNAAAFYGANAAIFGGDLTGKALVPLVEVRPGVFEGLIREETQEVTAGSELEAVEAEIRSSGSYPYRTTPDEVRQMSSDPATLQAIFSDVMRSAAEAWVSMADERLRAAGIPALMMPGNDDEPAVKAILAQGDWIIDAEGEAEDLLGYRVLSFGYSTTTPWHSPREVTEEEMDKALRELVLKGDPSTPTIFNIHEPPAKSGLDMAYAMTKDMRVRMAGGQAMLTPVGSTAVRALIEEHQPLLSLHGHIHESRATVKIGRTLSINPGSAYTEGVLQGVLVSLSGDRVKGFQMVTG